MFEVLNKCDDATLLHRHNQYPILAEDIKTLKKDQWLNDKVSFSL